VPAGGACDRCIQSGVTQCAGGWHGVPGGARGGAGHDAALWGAGGALNYFTCEGEVRC
jgi:hypothetical protein